MADTRTLEEKEAHKRLMQAGLDFYTISSIGDTSQIKNQAAMFRNYAISQGIDPEKQLGGIDRKAAMFAEIIPKEQEEAKKRLLETTVKNFNYALGGLNGQTAVSMAARIGATKEEAALEKMLSEPNSKLNEIKEAFSNMYKGDSLISHYIAINQNSEEVAKAAYGTLQLRSMQRTSEFAYQKDGKMIYNGNKAKEYIANNIEKTDSEIANEVRLEIGSYLAATRLQKEAEKAKAQKQD